MAYNRWLSGSQAYCQGDVLHYGRKGMKWYKNIFGLPKNLFSKKRIGPSIDIQSLRTLLQRGEIDFNTFKEMTNGVVYRPASSPSQTVTRRSSQQMRSIGESVGNSVKERKSREDREARSRAIAEEKARMGRQDEAKAKEAKERKRQGQQRFKTNRDQTSTSDKQTASNTSSAYSSKTKPNTSANSSNTAKETAEQDYNEALLKYINDLKSGSDEEARLRREEKKKRLAEERDREIHEKEQKLVSILWKIGRFLNRLV